MDRLGVLFVLCLMGVLQPQFGALRWCVHARVGVPRAYLAGCVSACPVGVSMQGMRSLDCTVLSRAARQFGGDLGWLGCNAVLQLMLPSVRFCCGGVLKCA